MIRAELVHHHAVKPQIGRRGETANGAANTEAFNAMSLCERECGLTADQLKAFHHEQRARVLARYGISVEE